MIEPTLHQLARLVPPVVLRFPLLDYSRHTICDATMTAVNYGMYVTDGSMLPPDFRFLDTPAIRFGHAAGIRPYSHDEKQPGVFTLETPIYSRLSKYLPEWRERWQADGIDVSKIIVAVAPAAAWLQDHHAKSRWCKAREEDMILLHREKFGTEPIYNLDGEHRAKKVESRKALYDQNVEDRQAGMESMMVNSNE